MNFMKGRKFKRARYSTLENLEKNNSIATNGVQGTSKQIFPKNCFKRFIKM